MSKNGKKARLWRLAVGFYFGALYRRIVAHLDFDTLSSKQQLNVKTE